MILKEQDVSSHSEIGEGEVHATNKISPTMIEDKQPITQQIAKRQDIKIIINFQQNLKSSNQINPKLAINNKEQNSPKFPPQVCEQNEQQIIKSNKRSVSKGKLKIYEQAQQKNPINIPQKIQTQQRNIHVSQNNFSRSDQIFSFNDGLIIYQESKNNGIQFGGNKNQSLDRLIHQLGRQQSKQLSINSNQSQNNIFHDRSLEGTLIHNFPQIIPQCQPRAQCDDKQINNQEYRINRQNNTALDIFDLSQRVNKRQQNNPYSNKTQNYTMKATIGRTQSQKYQKQQKINLQQQISKFISLQNKKQQDYKKYQNILQEHIKLIIHPQPKTIYGKQLLQNGLFLLSYIQLVTRKQINPFLMDYLFDYFFKKYQLKINKQIFIKQYQKIKLQCQQLKLLSLPRKSIQQLSQIKVMSILPQPSQKSKSKQKYISHKSSMKNKIKVRDTGTQTQTKQTKYPQQISKPIKRDLSSLRIQPSIKQNQEYEQDPIYIPNQKEKKNKKKSKDFKQVTVKQEAKENIKKKSDKKRYQSLNKSDKSSKMSKDNQNKSSKSQIRKSKRLQQKEKRTQTSKDKLSKPVIRKKSQRKSKKKNKKEK